MSYQEKETTLQAGEAAVLYSDGLVEAHDPKGEMFGVPTARFTIIGLVGDSRHARSNLERLGR
jgi:serine phosphatase RsbU (regulator of sigma subunit)